MGKRVHMGRTLKLSSDFDNKFIALKYFVPEGAVEFDYRVEQAREGYEVCKRDVCGPFLVLAIEQETQGPSTCPHRFAARSGARDDGVFEILAIRSQLRR